MSEQITSTTAFIFPGQGSQALGMGRGLAREFVEARRVFEEADDVLGQSLSRLCFEGPEHELQQTANTQPAILATSIAALRVLEARTDVRPGAALGHSLGEISALVAVGSLRFRDAVSLARLRGQAMQDAVPAGGSMAAIIGLSVAEVEALCEQAQTACGQIVSPANLNGASQIVVAGHVDAVEHVCDLAHELDARAVTLKVSAPFHCALMQPAAERLAVELERIEFCPMRAPVISCVDARPIERIDRIRGLLVAQVTNRVRWEESVRKALHMGCERGVEIGEGKVLRGLMRRIERSFKVYSLGEPDDLDKLPNDDPRGAIGTPLRGQASAVT